jgi:type I restriction enzyme S subunit
VIALFRDELGYRYFSNMDAEIATPEAKLAKARQLKHDMTQELLTGRTWLV